MSRRKKEDSEDEGIAGALVILAALGIWWLISKFRTNKEEFLHNIALPAFLSVVVVTALFIFWRKYRTRHFNDLLEQIKEKGLGENIKIFIHQEGRSKTKTNTWHHDVYTFDESHLEASRGVLAQRGVSVSLSNLKLILRHYIDNEGVDQLKGIFDSTLPHHSFTELMNRKGDDFEYLIARLYEGMGYASKRIGGSGDQGADVLAHKDGEHILIQAKCYEEGGVNNKAVQQAHSALPFYGCNKAVVITTSFFTQGAIDLAKADSVELIDKERLQQMLLDHLHESWS